MVGILMAASSAAAPPPPDYRAEVIRRAVRELEALQAAGDLDAVVSAGERFQRAVEPAADLAYEVALAENRRGRPTAAMARYDAVIQLDPAHAAARYDRGELHLARGDDAAAQVDFQAAAAARPDHWAVHFRLAQLSGRARDARSFEAHLTEALRHGFTFRTIRDDPTWRAWMRDPVLGSVLARLIVVYDDESVIEDLRGPP